MTPVLARDLEHPLGTAGRLREEQNQSPRARASARISAIQSCTRPRNSIVGWQGTWRMRGAGDAAPAVIVARRLDGQLLEAGGAREA